MEGVLARVVGNCCSPQDICDLTESIYIPRGINVTSLPREKNWSFQPTGIFKVGPPPA